jgi:hypothetical protein
VDEGDAKEIAREVIGPAGLLGYLVGRGQWWPNEAFLKNGKRSIGRVLAAAYDLLHPVWSQYPHLDPGKTPDALGLADRSVSLKDSPEDLCSALEDLRSAVDRVLPRLLAAFPANQRDLNESATALHRQADDATRAIRGAQASV